MEEKRTEQSPMPINEKMDTVTVSNLSKEESEKLAYILSRFADMKSKRDMISRDWQTYILQFESKFYPYADWRSRSNVPLEWAVVELFIAEALTRKSEIKIDPVWVADINKVEVLKKVKDYDWNKYTRDNDIYKSEYSVGIFGTCIYYTWYKETWRVIRDVAYDETTWEPTYIKKILKNNQIVLEPVDIRDVYLDDRVNNTDNINDVILFKYITQPELDALRYDKNYKKEDLDRVWFKQKDNQAFFTKEERWMLNKWLIEIMCYFNKQSDEYIEIANRWVIIREQPLPYAHKELPFVVRQYSYNPFSIYWRGICEALTNFKSQINTLKEMIMDWIKRSNNSMFAIGNWLQFDGSSFSFDNNVRKFQWQLTDANFREIRGQQPNAAIFNYTEQLLKDVAIYVWIDPSSIIGQPSSTAFETAVRQESSLKRVNVVLTNRDMALQKVYTQYLQLLMQYFPIKKAIEVLELTEESKNESPTILLDGQKPIVNKKWVSLVKANWIFALEVKPEYIRWQVDIRVITNFNKPTLRQLDRENMTQFINNTANLLNLIQLNPVLAEVIPPEQYIRDMADSYAINLDSVWGMKWSIEKEKAKLMDLVKQVAGLQQNPMTWWWAPSWPPDAWIWWWEQPPVELTPNVSNTPAWWLVRQPETPSMKNAWAKNNAAAIMAK